VVCLESFRAVTWSQSIYGENFHAACAGTPRTGTGY